MPSADSPVPTIDQATFASANQALGSDAPRRASRGPFIATVSVALVGLAAAAILGALYLSAAHDRDAARASLHTVTASLAGTNASTDSARRSLSGVQDSVTNAGLHSKYVGQTLADLAALRADFVPWNKDCDTSTYNADKCGTDQDAITTDLDKAQSDGANGQAPTSMLAVQQALGAAYAASVSDWQAWLDSGTQSAGDQALNKFFQDFTNVQKAAEAVAGAA
ncbi:MAG TPA: hypothetical protein VF137_04535 [Candidatus Dormibacteraeota bacterium]